MNDFTASNGIAIRTKDGDLDFKRPDPYGWFGLCGGEVVDALREFFQAEADERLGRWRSSIHPDFFVVWAFERETIHVCSDRFPAAGSALGVQDRSSAEEGDTVEHEVAREFFDAHPEPKPWHKAQIGETWVLLESHLGLAVTVVGGKDERWFTRATVYGRVERYELTDPSITDARRIWPEVSE